MSLPKKNNGDEKKPGTFEKNDPRINRNGRPPTGQALTDLARHYLEETDPETKLRKKDEFVKMCLKKALEGDKFFVKLMWNYLDGLPRGTIEHEGVLDVDHRLPPELQKVVDGIITGDKP